MNDPTHKTLTKAEARETAAYERGRVDERARELRAVLREADSRESLEGSAFAEWLSCRLSIAEREAAAPPGSPGGDPNAHVRSPHTLAECYPGEPMDGGGS
jgi:hypothetical protein